MKSFICTLFYCVFIYCSAIAQNKTEHWWGKSGFDVAYSAAATNDGGYVITGLTQSMVDTAGDIIVIKTNAHGDTIWTLQKGGPNLEGGNFVMQTADGGIMVSGHTEDFGAEDCDAFLMKLDHNGNYQWLHVYGGEEDDISEGVVELPTGEFVIAGITASYGNADTNENRHVYFVKTSSTGDMIWYKYYAGHGSEYAYSIASVAAGGFLAVGYSTSFGNGEKDGWLMRLNDNGDTLWTTLYKNGGETEYKNITPMPDGGYIVTGYTTQTKTCKPQGLVIKLDASGHKYWEKLYGDTTTGYMLNDVAIMPAGNFMFSGISYAHNAGGSAYVLTTDAGGNIIAANEYGGNYSLANCIAAHGSDGFLVAGSSCTHDPLADLYYMNMDNTVSAVPGLSMPSATLYPNPAKKQAVSIVLPSAAANEAASLYVTDMSGRQVYMQGNVPAKNIVIGAGVLAPGQYLFSITCEDGKEYKGKLVEE